MKTKNRMRNIFIMPCGAVKTQEHLSKTILEPVSQSTILPKVSEEAQQELKHVFGDQDIAVWGSADGRNNQIFFEKMKAGDSILFTVGRQVRVMGKIAVKTVSPELSKVLWPNDDGRLFSLIYFIDETVQVQTPLSEVFLALGYSEKYVIQGLTAVSEPRLKAFLEQYESIDAVVMANNRA